MAYTLTFTEEVKCTIDGVEVTSPYTLKNGDVINVQGTTELVVNSDTSAFEGGNEMNLSNTDIDITTSIKAVATSGVINYTEISQKSIDLTALSGWSSLSSGSHSITIVAKAENYRDSEPSEAVTVEKAAEEDALAGTWVLNDEPVVNDNISWEFNFSSNGVSNTSLEMTYYASPDMDIDMFTIDYSPGNGNVYCNDKNGNGIWGDEAYKTITITSKLSEVTDGETLLTWLQANATKQ